MTINDAARASRFGCLDDACAEDGRAFGADTLRTLAMQHNYLVSQGDCSLSLIWDADSSAEDGVGSFKGVGSPVWVPITPPLIVPKKPGLTEYTATLTCAWTGDVYFQFVTGRQPFDPAATVNSPNVMSFTGGSGGTTFSDKSITLAAADSDFDEVQVFGRGAPTGTLASGGGTPNTGTVTALWNDSQLYSSGATWNVTGVATSWAGTTCVVFRNAGGLTIEGHRLITGVTAANSLTFWPPTTAPLQSLLGSTYRIETLPTWRICHLAFYPAEET